MGLVMTGPNTHSLSVSDKDIANFKSFCSANGYSLESAWVALFHLTLTRFSLKEDLVFNGFGQDGAMYCEKLQSEDSFRDLTKRYSGKASKRTMIPPKVRCVDFNAELEIEKKEAGYEIHMSCEDYTELPAFMKSISEVFHTFLKSMPYYHKKNIYRIPCLTKKASREMAEFGRGEFKDIEQRSLGEIFFQVAEQNCEQIAILTPDQSITFGELSKRVERVADYFRQKYPFGTHVGVVADRSIEALVSIFGVWAANLSYVPLDPSSPEKRREYIISNAEIAEFVPREVLKASGSVHERIKASLRPPLAQDSVAYMIYTSGSTGRPKGCEIKQSSVKNLLSSLEARIYTQNSDVKRVALNAPLTFDASVQQLLALLLGKTLVLLDETTRRDADALALYLKKQKVDLLDATPSHYKFLLGSQEFAESEYPTVVLLGGEDIQADLKSEILDGSRSCFNVYGLTETTVDVTIGELSAMALSSSLGQPVFNTTLYVSDPDMNLVPPGVPGELWISGSGLAKSYWKSSGLTQKKFVSNPWLYSGNRSLQTGDKSIDETVVFRTGDLVKFHQDGSIQFIGRLDDQIKIRGHRVQLSEIEENIRSLRFVKDAVVVSQVKQNQGVSLHAFVIQRDENTQSDRDILKHISEFLPSYAVPSTCNTVKRFPLLSSRKVDRAKLLQMKDFKPIPSVEVAPLSLLEKDLVQLWQKNLHGIVVGIDSNYFESGGHSLLAAQLMCEVNEKYGLELSVGLIYQNPTLRELARSILDKSVESEFRHLVKVGEGAGKTPPIFCFHPAGGNAHFYKDTFTISQLKLEEIWCVQSGALDGGEEYRTPMEFTKNYSNEILQALHGRTQCHLLGWSLGGLLAFDVANFLESRGIEVLTIDLWDSGKIPTKERSKPDRGQGYLNTVKTLLAREQKTLNFNDEDWIRATAEGTDTSEIDRLLLHWLRTEKQYEIDLSPKVFGNSAKLAAFHDFLFQTFSPPSVHSSVYAIWACDDQNTPKRPWRTNTVGTYREEDIEEDHFSMVGKHNLPKLRNKFMAHVERSRGHV